MHMQTHAYIHTQMITALWQSDEWPPISSASGCGQSLSLVVPISSSFIDPLTSHQSQFGVCILTVPPRPQPLPHPAIQYWWIHSLMPPRITAKVLNLIGYYEDRCGGVLWRNLQKTKQRLWIWDMKKSEWVYFFFCCFLIQLRNSSLNLLQRLKENVEETCRKAGSFQRYSVQEASHWTAVESGERRVEVGWAAEVWCGEKKILPSLDSPS